jgi:sialate O-acetylesterase
MACAAIARGAEVRVPHMFSDNMVLQQAASVPIWGWGEDGDTITVRFQGQTVSTIVKNGQWMVRLEHLKPGGPETLRISSAASGSEPVIRLRNVLVGEVWLASGQSNMEFPLKNSFESSNDIANSENPNIHLLHVPRARLEDSTNDISAHWTECNPKTVSTFSAVEYYFARDLQEALHVPVGVIESDWGGTPIEVWMEPAYLRRQPRYQSEVMGAWSMAQNQYEHALAAYNQAKGAAKLSGAAFSGKEPNRPWRPGELYNGMIAPLAGYAVKGFLWYQGESNAGSEEDAWLYHYLLPDMIRNWRSIWSEPAAPFLLVQLAPFRAVDPTPAESSWASVREAQLEATKTLPNVGMAVITDVGDQRDIHPRRKKPVGARLALAALGIAYHQPIEYSGPQLQRVKVEDGQIVLTFTHVAGGLVARGEDGDKLVGFAVCGPDGRYVWAGAEIKGLNEVLVHSPQVPYPKAVRYGWGNYPVVNLYNKAGLPASPFRTDDFELRPPPPPLAQ